MMLHKYDYDDILLYEEVTATSSKRSESSKENLSCSSHSNITCPPSSPSGAAIQFTCNINVFSDD